MRKRGKQLGTLLLVAAIALLLSWGLLVVQTGRQKTARRKAYQASALATRARIEQNETKKRREALDQRVNGSFLGVVQNRAGETHWLYTMDTPLPSQELAFDYFQAYFEAEEETHFLVNYAEGTTTRIRYEAGRLLVDSYEHVSGEETKGELPDGRLLSSYVYDAKTGKMLEIAFREEIALSPTIPVQKLSPLFSTTPESGSQSRAASLSDTEETQPQERWILNTGTMKIHHPECPCVSQISPKNRCSSNASLEELKAQGYEPCRMKQEPPFD